MCQARVSPRRVRDLDGVASSLRGVDLAVRRDRLAQLGELRVQLGRHTGEQWPLILAARGDDDAGRARDEQREHQQVGP